MAFVLSFLLVVSVAANVFLYAQMKVNAQRYLSYANSSSAFHELLKGHAILLTSALQSSSEPQFSAATSALENNTTSISIWLGNHYGEAARYELQTIWRAQTAAMLAYARAAKKEDNGEKAKQLQQISGFPNLLRDFFVKLDPDVDQSALKATAALYVSRSKTLIDSYLAGDYTTFYKRQPELLVVMNSLAEIIAGNKQ